jgi:hypothetical protein
MADLKPSETSHVFLHEEGDALVAFYAGREIARKTRTTQERFFADLHVWSRKNKYEGPYWRVLSNGEIEEDKETPARAARAFENDAPV